MTTARFVALAAGLGSIGFIASFELVNWLATQHVYGSLHDALDVGLYQFYGHQILAGGVPYRTFGLEYPPFALPAFVVPALLSGDSPDPGAFRMAFQATMLVCGILTLGLVVSTLTTVTDRRADIAVAAGFVAVSPLLVGPVILARFDLWPVLLTAIAVAAVVRGRYRSGAAFVALAILAKVYSVVLVPLLVAYVWRRAGRREALVCGGIGAAVLLLVLGPFLIAATGGTIDVVGRVVARPLQVESLGGALLFVLHGIAGTDLHQVFSYGSDNVEGPVAGAFAAAQGVALGAWLIWIWLRFAKGAGEPVQLLLAAAAAVSASIALGKVLSDNYVVWLIPLVAVVPGRPGRIGMALLAAVLVLTAVVYPISYTAFVVDHDPVAAVVVLLRAVDVLALAIYLTARARPASSRLPPFRSARATAG